jgi:hypothetical protein
MEATCGGGAFVAIRSLTTGGFVRRGFANCNNPNATTTRTKIHFSILFI